jgi:serine/threonine protein kinase
MTETPSQDETGDDADSRGNGIANGNAETQLYFSSNDVVRVLDEYLEALKAGNAPSREELLARYPELQVQLDACLAGLTFLHSANHGSVPSQLGDFRLVREVGRGGMGAVFEAIQVSLGRHVALKVLRFSSVSDKEAIERFQREAETVATLHHTNIVPIYFVGSEKGVNYYAMQFIEGRNLAELMAAHGADITPAQVAGWALQAAEALSHAHRRGVIHRDVKPSNLILDKDDRLWLTDFGLARRQDDVTLSLTGMLLGTPRYMSPEHASASTKRIDHRSDLFSLGVTLYELLTHRPAFAGDAAQDVIHQILVDQPPPIRQLNPEVPRDFETIVMKCMAKEPEARYASADDLAADLRALIEDRPIRARRASPIEQATRWIKQNQRSVSQMSTAVMMTLAITLTSLLVWSSYRSWNASAIKLSAQRPPLVAEILSDTGETIRTETLPMQNAIDLPAGQYDIRVSADGTFSQNFSVALDRGNAGAKYTVNVNDQWLTTPQAVEHSYDFFDLGSEHGIVKWSSKGLTIQKPQGPSFEWSLDLSPQTQAALKEFPAYINPKRSIHFSSGGLGESNESRSWTIREFVDVNQDGVGDLVCAARHQAWVMAISGKGDGVLWFTGLGEELTDVAYAQQASSTSTSRSTVLQPPLQCDDLDGDGIRDMVVSVLSLDKSLRSQGGVYDCRRWFEAISTQTGKTIWRYEIPNQCFALSANQDVPYDLRWFTELYSSRSSRGGQTMFLGMDHLRTPPYFVQSGDHAYRPTNASLLSTPDTTAGIIVFAAGDQLIRINVATGKPIDAPQTLGFRPGTYVQWADMDGDGVQDMVTLEEIPTQPNELPDPRLVVWSIAKKRMLWSMPLDAYWPRGISEHLSRPEWPLVVDLDADGKSEVIAPNGRSHTANSFNGGALNNEVPRGKVVVLNGESGAERWSKSILTLDASIDYFIDGSDLDEDGVRDVYVASFDNKGKYLHVDALSGTNGNALWGTRKEWATSAFDGFRVMGLAWWNSGPDGWPQLLVTLSDQRFWTGHDFITTVAAFSAGTGELNTIGRNINECTPIDIDHDNAEELLVCSSSRENSNTTLHVLRGMKRQAWKRLGELGDVTADLNGDNIDDLVESWGDGTLVATDGATGKEIWRSRVIRTTSQLRVRILNQSVPSQFPSQNVPAPCDLNHDGYQDLIVFETHTSGQKKVPMHAVSGKTGSLLWSLQDVLVKSISDILSTTVTDIDQDGEPEVICLAAVDYGYPTSPFAFSNQDVQLWLFLAEATSGELCWAEPLSPAYGTSTQSTSPMQLNNFKIDLAYADLNDDQVYDLILPAVRADGALETRALSGLDGKLLWARERQPDGLSQQSLENWTAPSFCDFDGNGRPEIVLVEPLAHTNNATHQWIEVAITLLDANGEEQWMRPTGSVFTHFNSFSSRNGALLRPIVIHSQNANESVHTKTSRIALVLPSVPKLVLIDGEGKVEARDIKSHSHEMSRIFALDTDHDGTEELFFVDGDFVKSVQVNNLAEDQWTYSLGQLGQHKIIGIREASDLPPMLIAQTDCTRNRVIALHAKTGKPIWTCSGPIARADDMTSYVVPKQIAVLGNNDQQLPLVLFQYEFVNDCRQAILVNQNASESDAPMLATYRASAHVSGFADDPRLKRPLPWASDFRGDARMIWFVIWGCFFALTLVCIPLTYLFQLVARRRFQLSFLLLGPVVAAILLHSAIVTAPEDHDFNGFLARLSVAMAFTPPLVAIAMMGRWIATRQWRMVTGWLVAVVICGLLIAAVSVTVSLRTTPLVENQSFDGSGWYLVLLPAMYAISWLMMLFLIAQGLLRGASRQLVSRRSLPKRVEPTQAAPVNVLTSTSIQSVNNA